MDHPLGSAHRGSGYGLRHGSSSSWCTPVSEQHVPFDQGSPERYIVRPNIWLRTGPENHLSAPAQDAQLTVLALIHKISDLRKPPAAVLLPGGRKRLVNRCRYSISV